MFYCHHNCFSYKKMLHYLIWLLKLALHCQVSFQFMHLVILHIPLLDRKGITNWPQSSVRFTDGTLATLVKLLCHLGRGMTRKWTLICMDFVCPRICLLYLFTHLISCSANCRPWEGGLFSTTRSNWLFWYTTTCRHTHKQNSVFQCQRKWQTLA